MRLALYIAFLCVLPFWPLKAEACGRSSHEGFWSNIRQEEKTLSKLEIKGNCNNATGEGNLTIRAFESCRPRDCSWGWTEGVFQNNKLYALFRTFSAERRVEIMKRGFRLWVRVTTDYISENREDKVENFIFIKKAG